MPRECAAWMRCTPDSRWRRCRWAGHAGSNASTNRALDVHARGGVPPAVLAHVHQTLMTGLHYAFFAAVVAAALGAVAVLGMPGGSAREHEAREVQVEETMPDEVE